MLCPWFPYFLCTSSNATCDHVAAFCPYLPLLDDVRDKT